MRKIVRIFLDLEATQFSKEIISIGAISDKGEEFYRLIQVKRKITKLITDLTGITNNDLKKAHKFCEVFDEFWDWCCKQKTSKKEKVMFFVYGNFDRELIKAEYTRRPKDKRLFYIYNNIIDVQYHLMMSMYGTIAYSLSLLKATKQLTRNDSLEQDHNSLNDAKLLKLLYENIGNPNIENIIHAEKENCVRNIKKNYGKKSLKNKDLLNYLRQKENLSSLTFEEVIDYIDLTQIEDDIKKDCWVLSGQEYEDSIISILGEKESV